MIGQVAARGKAQSHGLPVGDGLLHPLGRQVIVEPGRQGDHAFQRRRLRRRPGHQRGPRDPGRPSPRTTRGTTASVPSGGAISGPRPALFNQQDLIELRTQAGVHHLSPGLTGWAQVNGRDELPIPAKVALDVEYLHGQSLILDIKIIFLTAWKVIHRDNVSH